MLVLGRGGHWVGGGMGYNIQDEGKHLLDRALERTHSMLAELNLQLGGLWGKYDSHERE